MSVQPNIDIAPMLPRLFSPNPTSSARMTPLLKGLFKAKSAASIGEDLHRPEHQTTTATNDQRLMPSVFLYISHAKYFIWWLV